MPHKMKKAEPRWTLQELRGCAELALSVDYAGPANGQIRAVPDERTIRFYTTLGLLARPAEMRGRTAFYSRHHLLQLVAIKRLQADGLTLGDIQQKLLGSDDRQLEEIARLPHSALEAPAEPLMMAAPAQHSRADEAFWEARPAPVAAAPAALPANAQLQGINLSNEVLLMWLKNGKELSADDVAAINDAAAPLLKILLERGLIPPPKNGGRSENM